MDVYYIVIVITFLIFFLYEGKGGGRNPYLRKLIWVFLPIFFFGALRENFGIDYPVYKAEYYLLNGHPENIDEVTMHSELGYQWLEVFIPSWRLLVMLVSTMVVVAFIFLYYKYVDSKMLLFILFFTFFYPDQSFFLNFVAMRNGLVIAIFWLSIPLIVERKYLYAIAITLILFFIHKSALIFVSMALIVGQNFKISYKEITLWIIAIVVLSLMSTANLIKVVLPLMGSDEFESYREHYLIDSGHSTWLYGLANVVFIYFIFKWAFRNRNILTSSQNVIWRLALLYLMCPYLGPIGRTRMNYYFFPFYIITLSYLVKDKWTFKGEKLLFIIYATTIMFYATFWIWMNRSIFPYAHYQSILDGVSFF